jgi:glycerophosphoryl diester phosphodiesterase
MQTGETEGREFILISHRGGGEFGPENSLEALEGALRAGVANIETDVHQSRDGVMVISHEYRVNLHVLQKTDFSWIREHHPEIPSLAEFLDLADGRCRFNLEVKQAEPALLLETLRERDTHRILFSSFSEEIVRGLRELDRDLPLGLLIFNDQFRREKVAKLIDELDLQVILPFYVLSEERLVGLAHERGIKVIAWTVNGLPHLERMLEMEVDGVFTDTYSEFRDYLEGIGRTLIKYPH